MYLLVVQHRVADFDRFKAVFDSHPPSHGGATSHEMSRGVDEPDDITIIATFASLDEVVAWRDNPELRAAMADAGVVGTPRVEVFERVDGGTQR